MIVPSFGNQNPKSNNEQFGVMKAVTPETLNEIEARAKADSLYLNDRWVKDVLALVAAHRELKAEVAQLTKDEPLYHHEWEKMLNARAEKAEARVYALELEREDAGAYEGAYEGLWRRTCSNVLQLEARVAVLREALDDANKTCNFQSVGWGRELGARLNLVLATLDPAATALTERLKAWESAPFFRSDGGREAHHCLSHAAWRKVKGETP